jgi:oligoendopeptidase F
MTESMTEPHDVKEFPRTFVPSEADLGDWDTLEPLFEELVGRTLSSSADLEDWLLDRSELSACLSEERSRRYIDMTCDTTDEGKEHRYLEFIETIIPKVKPYWHRLNQIYVECDGRRSLDDDRYGVLDREIEAEIEIFREENIPLQTEAAKLSQQYQKLIGAMTVTYAGKEYTLPQVAKFLEETDRSVRREVWTLVAERRQQDREELHEIFDRLVDLRHQIARNAGFDDYRGYAFKAMQRFDYTIEDAEAFHRAVEECVVPLYRQLNERRLALLREDESQNGGNGGESAAEAGEKDPRVPGGSSTAASETSYDSLRPWDTEVDPLGRDPLRPFEAVGELTGGVRQILARIDADLESQFAGMLERGELDLDSRKGKAPGGYMSTRDEVRRPFIFMNAAGLHRDVEVLLHESGHAFHSLAARNDPIVAYRHAPIEFAEVASMTMELFADDLYGVFYDEDEAARAKRKHLEGIIRLLPWVAQIDAFQHWVYAHPEHSREERARHWLELEGRFGPALDWSGYEHVRESLWQRQLHLYEVPFYYIEYGIAQLGALQIWTQFREDAAAAVGNYRSALALGGSRPLPELFAAAGARFDFSADTIAPLMDAVDTELSALPA